MDDEKITVRDVVRRDGEVRKATIEARYGGVVRYSATFVKKDGNGRLTAADRIRYTETGVPEERNVHIPKSIFARMSERAYAIFGERRNETESSGGTDVLPGSGDDGERDLFEKHR